MFAIEPDGTRTRRSVGRPPGEVRSRPVGKNEASIRRLLTAPVNPELRTVVALADALDADIRIVPRKRTAARRKTQVA